MITIKKRNAVPRAELTCRGCGSILEYGNEDLVEFVTETAHYLTDNNDYLARNYKLKCPVCNIEQPAPWIQGQKTTSAPQIPSTNEELVDLGLPSGTLWSKFNLGAEKETDFGRFFQWGDTQGHKDASEHQFKRNDYKWEIPLSITKAKYNNLDNKLVLDNEDDPVFVATSGKQKMPTKEQMQELIDYTDHKWATIDGVNGMKFISKNDQSKYIFIPAAGYYYDGSHNDVGSWACVWSASRSEYSASSVWCMYFDAGDVDMGYYTRWYGYNVRGVVVPEDKEEKSYDEEPYDKIDDYDDGQPVDLGLPSGTLWQKSNLGASTPSDFGLFYQWGDTKGYDGDARHGFNWYTYKYGTSWDNSTKYNNTDGKTTLDNDDDPVYVASSGQYKSPTQEQLQELMDNTDHQWVRLANGVNGMKFVNRGDDTKYIFIPAAGFCYDSYHNGMNTWGYIWSSSRDCYMPNRAWSMYFYSGFVDISNNSRCYGYNIRGIMNKKNS